MNDMMKHWMIAGLMGATVLTGVAPSASAAAEQDRTENRWRDRGDAAPRASSEGSVRLRGEGRPGWPDSRAQARQDRGDVGRARVEAARDGRQDRVDAVREARRERVEGVREDRRDWRNDRRDDIRTGRQTAPQIRQDRNDDRRDWRQNQRDDRRDWRQNQRDDRRDWRDNRRWDYRDADRRYSWDRDWRRDQRYDWQRYRQTHRHIYRGPRYYAPRGWDYGYRRFSIGISLWSGLYADRYWIDDPWYYRLPPAYGTLRWVRYYDDALLVDIRTGYVVDVIHDFFW